MVWNPVRRRAAVRRAFFFALWAGVRLTWPILSGLVTLKICLGIIISMIEGWSKIDGIYFAFITGLTIGYGDLVPVRGISRVLAVSIGFCGVLLTGVIAALVVRALQLAAPVDQLTPRQ